MKQLMIYHKITGVVCEPAAVTTNIRLLGPFSASYIIIMGIHERKVNSHFNINYSKRMQFYGNFAAKGLKNIRVRPQQTLSKLKSKNHTILC